MREWLARIAADIKRANKWLDPAYVPKPSWQPSHACNTTASVTSTYMWTAGDGWTVTSWEYRQR